jgi:hypothetical protein
LNPLKRKKWAIAGRERKTNLEFEEEKESID